MSGQNSSSRFSGLTIPPTGRVVGGKYEIVRPLAEGGMGSVYVARHLLTRMEVALKLMHFEESQRESAVERFLREVRFAAEIGHPAIVKVHDAGEDDDGTPFLAMELLSGEDMAQRLARPTTTAGQALDLLLCVLEPLAAAHERGIVHRDLKPENVFLARQKDGSEVVKLLDFGIAREVGVSSKTSAGTGLGTTHYMSPEQAANARDARPASDVWALGVMLYESITGTLPFDGTTVSEVIIRAFSEPHAPLQQLLPGIDARLASLVDRCLAKKPGPRPPDAGVLRAELEPLLGSPEVRASLTGGRGGVRAGDGSTGALGALGLPSSTPPRGRGNPLASTVDDLSQAAGARHVSGVRTQLPEVAAVSLPGAASTGLDAPDAVAYVAEAAPRRRAWPIAAGGAAMLLVAGVAASWFFARSSERETSAIGLSGAVAGSPTSTLAAAAPSTTSRSDTDASADAGAVVTTSPDAAAEQSLRSSDRATAAVVPVRQARPRSANGATDPARAAFAQPADVSPTGPAPTAAQLGARPRPAVAEPAPAPRSSASPATAPQVFAPAPIVPRPRPLPATPAPRRARPEPPLAPPVVTF